MNKPQLYLGTLLGLQLLLGAGIFVSQASTGSSQAPTPLLAFAAGDVDQLVIADAERKLTLQRQEDGWQLADSALPANAAKVNTLLDNLAALKTGWPVANTASSRERFEVEDDRFQRHLTLTNDDGTLGELYFGTSPGFRQTHGRRAGEDEVYSLAFNSIDLPVEPSDWLDKSLLGADGVQRIEGSDFVLQKEGDAWTLQDAADGETLDQDKATALVNAVQNLRVLRLLDAEPALKDGETREESQLLAVKDDQRWQYTLTKVGSTAFVARDDRPQRFSVSTTDYDRLAKATRASLLAATTVAAAEAPAATEGSAAEGSAAEAALAATAAGADSTAAPDSTVQ